MRHASFLALIAAGLFIFGCKSAPAPVEKVEKPVTIAPDGSYISQRPGISGRAYSNSTIEEVIAKTVAKLKNPRLQWMFANCFPNTLDTTVEYTEEKI